MSDAKSGPPAQNSPTLPMVMGFVGSVGLFGAAFVIPPRHGDGLLFSSILAITVLPLAAIILAIIRPTRKFGLGMLLGCGAIWLVMLAICSGMRIG